MKGKLGYEALTKRIEKLKAEAALVRKSEVGEVIKRIQVAIDHYDLTPEDLFGGRLKTRGLKVKMAAGLKPPTKSKSASPVKYRDSAGNGWVGRGPRPLWLRQALAAGAKLEQFLVSA